jgi:hypothetical protein
MLETSIAVARIKIRSSRHSSDSAPTGRLVRRGFLNVKCRCDQWKDAIRHGQSEARALQRASSESAMNADDGWESDLRIVRKALDRLGAVEPPRVLQASRTDRSRIGGLPLQLPRATSRNPGP